MAGRLAEWVTGGRLSKFLKCEVWRGLRITWAGRVCRYRDWTQMPVTVREMPAGRSAACLGALPGSNRAWDPGRTVRTSLLALTTSTRHFVPSTMGRLTHSGSCSESDTYWKLGSYTICLRLGLGHGSELGLCWPARKGSLEGKGDTAARQYVM